MRVEVETDLYTKAEIEFGNDERPDYDDFCFGPLAAIVFACERNSVRAQPLAEFPGIFTSVLPASGMFSPVVFSLALVDAGQAWLIYDYVVDHDYWDILGQDLED